MIHLHVHSEYSLLDGMCRISPMLEKCKTLGMNAVAITDHGVLYGVIDFYSKAKAAGIKPIIGLEAYITEDRLLKGKKEIEAAGYDIYHIVLLAKNNTGYKNLLAIVTDSYLNGFFSKPRTDLAFLREHHDGLICLTACLAGQIPVAILNNNDEKAISLINEYYNIFGEDLYLEIQANTLRDQEKVNKWLTSVKLPIKTKFVVTCDAHYLEKDDAFTHEVLLAAQTNQIVGSPKALRFPSNEFWFKTEEEVRVTTPGVEPEILEEAIKNTHIIAEQCNVEIEFGNNLLPKYETNDGSSLEDYLTRICQESLMEYYFKEDIDYYEYRKRLDYELSVINNAGFAGYFLIVADFISWSKNQGYVVGPGRGSAAGCLVAYLLHITDPHMDPIKNGLLFERFLNPERKEMPDIDVDVHPDHRYKVIEYIRHKYGEDNVAQIGTLGIMGAKKAIQKAGGALGIPAAVRDEITKCVPGANDIELSEDEELDLETCIKHSPALQDYMVKYPSLFEMASRFEGLPSNASIHAGGVVVAPQKITEYAPLQLGRDNEIVTQFHMKDIEKLGLIKVDVLGVNTLRIIDDTIKMARENGKDAPNVEEIGVDDEEPYRMLCSLETEGIFQVESDMFRRIIKDMQPSKFSEWVDLVALGRPGPLLSGMVDSYCRRKKGIEPIVYVHPKLEPILKDTYGVMCIAENSMVRTIDGQKAIQDIEPGDMVLTHNGRYKKVLAKIDNGIRKTVRVRTTFGEELVCTPDHKVLTSRGWVEAKDLKYGDLIKAFSVENVGGDVGDDKDWLIGYAIANGDLTATTICIACPNENFAHRLRDIAEAAFGLKNCRVFFNTRCWYVSLGHYKAGGGNKNNPFTETIRILNLTKDCYNKRLPANASLAMITGFIEGDGCLQNNTVRLSNRELAYDLYLALQRHDIQSSFFVDNNVPTVRFCDTKGKLQFRIKENIYAGHRFYLPRNEVVAACEAKYGLGRHNIYPSPKFRELVKNVRSSDCPYITGDVVKKLGVTIEHQTWGMVLSVKDDIERRVYDLSVEDDHSFVVGGLVVHNCYQEQVMEICKVLAGYSAGEADKVRKIMGKKQADLLPAEEEKFLQRCQERGEDITICKQIWDAMACFAGYGFNKSHAACYALTSYRTMWLKWKYPVEFFCTVLTKEVEDRKSDSDKQIANYIKKAKEKGINILPPHINKSSIDFRPEGNNIRVGFAAIYGIGKSAQKIIENRPYESFEDFLSKNNDSRLINKKVVTALIYSGCFDEFEPNRHKLYKKYLEIRASKKIKDKDDDINSIPNRWTRKDIISYEKEFLGVPISVETKWDACRDGDSILTSGKIVYMRESMTKNGKLMGFVSIETDECTIPAIIFLEQWLEARKIIKEGTLVKVSGRKSDNKLIVKRIEAI